MISLDKQELICIRPAVLNDIFKCLNTDRRICIIIVPSCICCIISYCQYTVNLCNTIIIDCF